MRPGVPDTEIYDQFRRAVLRRDCVAFIGSGPSCRIYPTWTKLVPMICHDCGVTVSEDLSNAQTETLLSLTDRARKSNESAYKSSLQTIFGYPPVRTSRIYECLINAPFTAYLTLNLDPLLAVAARNPDPDTPIYHYPSLNAFELRDGAVYYLHGLIHAETRIEDINVVLSASEFDCAYSPNSLLTGLLEQVFTYKRVCFIGCGLSERPLQELLSRCAQFRDGFFTPRGMRSPKHFILLPRVEPVTPGDSTLVEQQRQTELAGVEMQGSENPYREMGISVVWYDPRDEDHSGLLSILDDLAEVEPLRTQTGFEGLYK